MLYVLFGYGIIRVSLVWINYLRIEKPNEVAIPAKNLSVAVFTTSAPGEPLSMFENTFKALKNLNYPHTTYLLDGTEDAAFKELAEEQNVNLQNQPISGNPAGVKTVDDTWLDRQIENQNAQDNATRDLREANREYTTAVQAYNTYGAAAFRQDPTLRGRLEKAVADRQRLTAELNRLEQERTAIDANKPAGNF